MRTPRRTALMSHEVEMMGRSPDLSDWREFEELDDLDYADEDELEEEEYQRPQMPALPRGKHPLHRMERPLRRHHADEEAEYPERPAPRRPLRPPMKPKRSRGHEPVRRRPPALPHHSNVQECANELMDASYDLRRVASIMQRRSVRQRDVLELDRLIDSLEAVRKSL